MSDEDSLEKAPKGNTGKHKKPSRSFGFASIARSRHKGLVAAYFLVAIVPTLAALVYLVLFAQPQFSSRFGFVVRSVEQAPDAELLGGLGSLVGNASSGDSDILFEFMQSSEIVRNIDEKVDLVSHYSQHWVTDPVFSISPRATDLDLSDYWRRILRLTYDQASGMLMVEVRALSSEVALQISEEIITESEAMINALNETARLDSMEIAQKDMEDAFEHYQSARKAVIEFQARTQIIDPEADIQARMGVLTNLQQELTTALVDYDLYKQQTQNDSDPRINQLELRISVIRERIATERSNFARDNVTASNTDYPTLLSEYEGLRVDLLFAEENYRAARTALTAARNRAERQQLYVATFIGPTTPEAAEYPRIPLLVFLTFFFASMAWAVMALVYYSLRDRG